MLGTHKKKKTRTRKPKTYKINHCTPFYLSGLNQSKAVKCCQDVTQEYLGNSKIRNLEE